MKKLALLAAVALVALTGCAADTHVSFTDQQAQTVLYGPETQSSYAALGFSGATSTIATDTVEKYLEGVKGGGDIFNPSTCENSARLLVLADKDATSQDTFYVLPALVNGSTIVNVKARLFATDGAAKQFLADYQKAVEGCPSFTDTQGSDTIGVRVAVSEADADGKGFRMDTLAGTSANPTSFRTYVVREGNLAVSVQAVTATDDDANLLVAASTALYAAMTAGAQE